ncbi:FAD-binding oxidoreductase [Panacibacter ginsenosidivorans]|uniref:FAD-binding oxidoreductase n=1 Tax=Panacibacter ginsenosidivorans TaxID=1813871 RepID=A0A5B8V6X5_9BACT|nr:FAD-binding protein [Panacibacter ginsenosidivorans]QEC67184.1 FAD-binding oxidoreductase [Panacibacter ginsenosidivorans]
MTNELINALKNSLHGKLVLPNDADYDTLRKVYNGMIDKHPAMIAQCTDVEDVKTCINFAKENNVLLSIRGGGHNAGGLGIADDALVIDLSHMKDIKIDTATKTVRVQGGVLLKELDAATHEVGMSVPSGIFGTTGVSGLTLGGGLGHMTRQYGLSIDNLLEAQVVLANGNQVTASANENPDLFWALRGGGGNFGVVVSFTFQLQPTATIYGGPMLWNIEDSKEMMTWYNNLITTAPDNINGFFAFLTVPPFPPFPEHLHMKKMCGVVWCYTGDLDKAEEVFKPIRAYKTPALDFVGPLPVPALQTMFDGLYPPGLMWYWKADFVKDLHEVSIDIHAKFGNEMPTPLSSMHMYPVNGAASRVGKSDTAWNYRDANYAVVIVGIDSDTANKDKIISWARDYWNALHPFSAGGAYVNFMMDEGEDRIKATYGDNYKRLAAIKAKYDPGNLFRVNQNIKPQMVEAPAMA